MAIEENIILDDDWEVEFTSDGIRGPQGPVGPQGPQGEKGIDITGIEKTSTTGLVDKYTITYSDGTTDELELTNGADGDDGVGISEIIKVDTTGLIDTYRVKYTNGNSTTFTVTNGEKGDKGDKGVQGEKGNKGDKGETGDTGFSPIANVSKSGTVATITITDANGTTTAQVSDGTGKITDVKVDGASVVNNNVANIDLTGKVDKVEGKQLSSNDYTNAEKSKLQGIEEGAEVNVNADWNATSGKAQILNKPEIQQGGNPLTDKCNLPDNVSANGLLPDGIFISATTNPIMANAVYGNGVYVKTFASSNNYYVNYSIGGSPRSYNSISISSNYNAYSNVIFDGTQFVFILRDAWNNPNIYTSPNGSTWTHTSSFPYNLYIENIALFYVNNKYIICRRHPDYNAILQYYVSENLINWTQYEYEYSYSRNVSCSLIFHSEITKDNMAYFAMLVNGESDDKIIGIDTDTMQMSVVLSFSRNSFNVTNITTCCSSPSGTIYWLNSNNKCLQLSGTIRTANAISYDAQQNLLCTLYNDTMWFSQGTTDRAITYTLPSNQNGCLIDGNAVYTNNYKMALAIANIQYDFDIPLTEYENNMVFKMQATNEVGIVNNYININNLGAKLIDTKLEENSYYDLIYDATNDKFLTNNTIVVTGKFTTSNSNLQYIELDFEPDLVICYSDNNQTSVTANSNNCNYRVVPRILSKAALDASSGCITDTGFSYAVSISSGPYPVIYYIAIKY